MFDTIPVSMFLISEINAMSVTGVFQRCSAIDEKHSGFNIMLLGEFGKERVGENVSEVKTSSTPTTTVGRC